MDAVKTINWIALFLAVLGPLMGGVITVEGLTTVMFVLGLIVALATYNSGIDTNGITLLLLASLAMLLLSSSVKIYSLVEYLGNVMILGAWYVLPIALVHGWKSLVS